MMTGSSQMYIFLWYISNYQKEHQWIPQYDDDEYFAV